MDTAELTVHLPKDDLEFVERYAREHGITVSELIDRYLRRLKTEPRTASAIHPEVARISGLVPADVDARSDPPPLTTRLS